MWTSEIDWNPPTPERATKVSLPTKVPVMIQPHDTIGTDTAYMNGCDVHRNHPSILLYKYKDACIECVIKSWSYQIRCSMCNRTVCWTATDPVISNIVWCADCVKKANAHRKVWQAHLKKKFQ
jgi:hypothetical protein